MIYVLRLAEKSIGFSAGSIKGFQFGVGDTWQEQGGAFLFDHVANQSIDRQVP